MAVPDLSRPDEYEQTGAGLRDLLQRFKTARTSEQLQCVAPEAERRAAQPGLESAIETAYGVLADLARSHAVALTPNETPDLEEGI
jgi:hypothetical protein